MKKLQEIELCLLKEFIRICKKLKLNYYLFGGSVLGAVKYSGFIPWDDDIDVAMPRKDYEIFILKAPKLLKKSYFLQNHKSDYWYPNSFSKLRDCNTTFIEKSVSHININHGIYIDIFPLDGYPSSKKEQKIFDLKNKLYKLMISCVYKLNAKFYTKLFFAFERMIKLDFFSNKFVDCSEKLFKKYSLDDSKLWCNHTHYQGKLNYFDRDIFGDGMVVKFEGINVIIPKKYNEFLSQKYPNWQLELSESEKKGHHYCEIIDYDNSYTKYVCTSDDDHYISLKK